MMSERRRVICIVLDGVGLEALPDAAAYGDADAATLPHVADACGGLQLPNLQRLGLGNLAAIAGVPAIAAPAGAYGRMLEKSPGKDSTTGHWELAGVILDHPFMTYPQGFPAELVQAFAALAGKPPLGNVTASGISILREYGAEHVRTGRPILYTSVDSVFQVAAHEEILTPEALHELCRQARELVDPYGVARVIARPFEGTAAGGFRRTSRRKDFSLPPPQKTILEHLTDNGHRVSTLGKISDLFAGCGVSQEVTTTSNADGMVKTLAALDTLDGGLLMVNLIDFDMVYGHRRDAIGFGRSLEEFDAWLPRLISRMQGDDLLLVTADHGCDPTTPGTDHTRESVPVLAWSHNLKAGVDLGVRETFADVGATLAAYFGVTGTGSGTSFLEVLAGCGRVGQRLS